MSGRGKLERLRKQMDDAMGGEGGVTLIFHEAPDGTLMDFNRETREFEVVTQEDIDSVGKVALVVHLRWPWPWAGGNDDGWAEACEKVEKSHGVELEFGQVG